MRIHEKVIRRMCSQEKWVRKYRKQDSQGGEIKSHEEQTHPDPARDSGVTSGGHAKPQARMLGFYVHASVCRWLKAALGKTEQSWLTVSVGTGASKARAIF